MVSRRVWLYSILLISSVATFASTPAEAQAYGPRQYYSSWNQHPSRSYHYRSYYYKPTATYSGYKHHYVVYHPSKPQYLYFYNPYKRQYWGRCPVGAQGEGKYSMLAEKDRKGSLSEIPESAFPAPSAVPAAPETEDKIPLDLPPDDLPDASQPGLTVPSPPP